MFMRKLCLLVLNAETQFINVVTAGAGTLCASLQRGVWVFPLMKL